jgi:pimeloyl-ACP methyl ester carboxylesterase
LAAPRSSRRATYLILIPVLLLGGFGARRLADSHLRSLSLLVKFSDPQAPGIAGSFANHPIVEELATAQTSRGMVKFRSFTPRDVTHPPSILLLHGVHHLGIDDPRLINLSRAMAMSGVQIIAPELKDLTEYHVSPETVDDIGNDAAYFSQQSGRRVGVIGLSFAGGLALIAASRPEYADKMGFVLAVGSHDSMSRVAKFFASNLEVRPNGSQEHFQAHEYGVLILAYSHLEDCFKPADLPSAHEALRRRLWEQPEIIPPSMLSQQGRTEMDLLVNHRERLEQAMLNEIARHRKEMDAVSPEGKMSTLHVPVYLLHGAGDNVIPPSESLWLARDVPHDDLRAVLISSALVHVDMDKKVTLSDEWALVHFMAKVLDAADGMRR